MRGRRWLSGTDCGSLLTPVFPRRDPIRVRPQAATFRAGLALSVGEFAGLVVPHLAPPRGGNPEHAGHTSELVFGPAPGTIPRLTWLPASSRTDLCRFLCHKSRSTIAPIDSRPAREPDSPSQACESVRRIRSFDAASARSDVQADLSPLVLVLCRPWNW
jgi:hypothetical protein